MGRVRPRKREWSPGRCGEHGAIAVRHAQYSGMETTLLVVLLTCHVIIPLHPQSHLSQEPLPRSQPQTAWQSQEEVERVHPLSHLW